MAVRKPFQDRIARKLFILTSFLGFSLDLRGYKYFMYCRVLFFTRGNESRAQCDKKKDVKKGVQEGEEFGSDVKCVSKEEKRGLGAGKICGLQTVTLRKKLSAELLDNQHSDPS